MINRRSLSSLLVVMVMAIAMSGCGQSSKDKVNNRPTIAPPTPGIDTPAVATAPEIDRTGWPVIVAFGDSLTEGLRVDSKQNYPSQLQDELDKRGYKYRVVNAGISGDTTTGGLGRIEAVLKHEPKIVILELGANDGLQGKDVKIMRSNLEKMIARLTEANIKVVLAGMEVPPNYGQQYTTDFRQVYTDLAATYDVALIPFFLDGVGGKPNLNQTDGIHPTAEGYVYVVANVMKTLEPLLEKP